MRKIYSFIALSIVLASCSNDEISSVQGSEQEVSFSVNIPESISSRAASGKNSALGGISNTENPAVTFSVALYEGDNKVYESSQTVNGGAKEATFKPRLIVGQQYDLVAYANINGDAVALDSKTATVTTAPAINDETMDAYFCSTSVKAEPQMSAELTRPYGKLRIVATDMNAAAMTPKGDIKKVTIAYTDARSNTFCPSTGVWEAASASSNVLASETVTEYTEGHDATDGCQTILVDYLPATSSTTDDIWHFTVTVEFENGEPFSRTFALDIPVRRNHLTTIIGDFFTAESNLDVYIDETIDNVTTTADGLTAKFANLKAGDETVISLGADLTVENGTTLSIPAGATVTLDLGNSTLSNNVANAPALVNEGTLIIKNGSLYNGSTVDGVSGAPQDALVNKGGTVIIENGVFGSNDGIGSALESYGGEVIIKDGTFYAADRNTYTNNAAYAFNFYQEAKVTIYNATVDCAPNGIFYVDNSEVTIHDGYYALGGAPNNYYWANLQNGGKMKVLAGTCKFTGSENCIWPIYEGKTLCFGGSGNTPTNALFSSDCTFVGEHWNGFTGNMTVAEASSQSDFSSAIASDNSIVKLADNTTFTLPSKIGDNAIIEGGEGTVIDLSGKIYSGLDNVVFKDLTIKEDTGNYNGIQDSDYIYYENCNIEGVLWVYSTNTFFNKCTFSNTDNVYNAWVYGGGKAVFTECEFKNEHNRALLIYNEGNKEFDITVSRCKFTANQTTSDKAAIQLHTELGIYGSLTINNSSATGYYDQSGTGQLWSEVANVKPRPVKSYKFDVTVDGTKVQSAQ